MSEPIDEHLKVWFVSVLEITEADASFMARNFREGLRHAGYVIVAQPPLPTLVEDDEGR